MLKAMDDINCDQKYLRDLMLSIHHNSMTPIMSTRSPGKLRYARWLTVANRILRHYVSVSDPAANLILMVNFVINVHAKAWFYIKTKSLFTDSPTHLFNMIQNAVQLDDSRVTEVMFRVIENNSFALHSENLSCVMLVDSRPSIR